jgi:putative ABC transport system permease protein
VNNGPALILRLALRETRGGLKGFTVFLSCLALGVAAMTLVGSLAASLEAGLKTDARRIMGGDLEIRQIYQPIAAEAISYIESQGARISRLAYLRVMVRPQKGRSTLAALKVLDANYPLVGELSLKGGGDPQKALAGAGGFSEAKGLPGALAEQNLFTRLDLKVGDVVQLGGVKLRLTGIIDKEPDRASAGLRLAPRLMVNWAALKDSGLIQPGSMVYYVYRVLLPEGITPEEMRDQLKERFDASGWRLRVLTQSGRRVGRTINNMSLYLTLVSLAALLVGGIGVAGAVENHLEAKKSSIAAMKCLGASKRQVMGIYLSQVMLFAALGTFVGILAGLLGYYFAAGYLAGLLEVKVVLGLFPAKLASAAACGLLTALAFTLTPLSSAALVSPARLFRGAAESQAPPSSWSSRLYSALSFIALFGVVLYTTSDRSLAWGFALAVLGSALMLGIFGWLIKRLAAHLPRPKDPRLAAALGNLHRPGAATANVIFSLGLGLTVLIAVYLVDANIRYQVESEMPKQAPTFYFLDVPSGDIDDFRKLVSAQPGLTELTAQPALRGRITRLNGTPADQVKVAPQVSWALRGARWLSFADEMPKQGGLVKGQWWEPDYKGPPLISFDADLAQGFNLDIGDSLTINVLGREITARIHNLRKIDWRTLQLNYSIIFAPGVLEGAPFTYLASAHTAEDSGDRLFSAVSKAYPNVATVNVKELLSEVTALLQKVSLAIRSMAGLTLIAGLLVLSQALRTNLTRRYYEAVVFKVFGATKKDLLYCLAAEFGLLGGAAAIMAAGLGSLASYAFIAYFTRQEWTFIPLPVVLIITGGVLATVFMGLLGVRRTLKGKAMGVLRNP